MQVQLLMKSYDAMGSQALSAQNMWQLSGTVVVQVLVSAPTPIYSTTLVH